MLRPLSARAAACSGGSLASLASGPAHSASAAALQAACISADVRTGGGCRTISSSPSARGLEEFFELPMEEKGAKQIVGRAWRAEELRTKSWDDLHKLWYVLLKERNMLQSEKLRAKARKEQMDNPFRTTKVRKSMARLKHVLGERAIAAQLTDPHRARELKAFIDAI